MLGAALAPLLVQAEPLRPCPPADAPDYYFPKGTFAARSRDDDSFVRRWYSTQLAAAKQASLSCGKAQHSYRFTWLRSFHQPVVIGVTLRGAQAELEAVELDGAGGYGPGKLKRDVRKTLSADDADAVHALIDALGKEQSTVENLTFDGAEWIVERREADSYRVWSRTSPDTGPIRELGLKLLQLTGWTYPAKLVY